MFSRYFTFEITTQKIFYIYSPVNDGFTNSRNFYMYMYIQNTNTLLDQQTNSNYAAKEL